jgi:phosphoribosylformylglycinamidine (FGAM) synthase-like enzyme
VGTVNQTTNAPSDAAVVKVKGTNKSIAMSVDCNSRYIYADPFKGTMIAVSEAARNIVCSGGDPAAVTNCLNFGNPYNTEVYWQFVNAIKGMGEACLKFGTPVTGGNVSFYNQSSDNDAVFPTPTIGMVGLVDGPHMTLDFKQAGDVVYLVGKSQNDIASSQYLVSQHNVQFSPAPHFELEEEFNLHNAIKAVIAQSLVQSAHDLSEGGLFIALLESAMHRNLGFEVSGPNAGLRTDAYLFGEAQSRVVVSVKAADVAAFEKAIASTNVPFEKLGEVTSGSITVGGESFGSAAEYKDAYNNALANYLA